MTNVTTHGLQQCHNATIVEVINQLINRNIPVLVTYIVNVLIEIKIVIHVTLYN